MPVLTKNCFFRRSLATTIGHWSRMTLGQKIEAMREFAKANHVNLTQVHLNDMINHLEMAHKFLLEGSHGEGRS